MHDPRSLSASVHEPIGRRKAAHRAGAEALLQTLQDMPRLGYIKTPDSIGYDLRFARKERGEAIDYPFTSSNCEPAGREGEGKISLFSKIEMRPARVGPLSVIP